MENCQDNKIDKELDKDINTLLYGAGFKLSYNEDGYKIKQNEIGALWENQGKHGPYYKGKIDGRNVVIFLTGKKPPKPQLIVLKMTSDRTPGGQHDNT